MSFESLLFRLGLQEMGGILEDNWYAGEYRGRPVVLRPLQTGRHSYARIIEVSHSANMIAKLRLYPSVRMLDLDRNTLISIGDPQWDAKFKLTISGVYDEKFARAFFLDPQVRYFMLGLPDWYSYIEFREGVFECRISLSESEAKDDSDWVRFFDILCYLAEHFEHVSPQAAPVKEATYLCNTCGSKLRFVAQYQKWYCNKCAKYA